MFDAITGTMSRNFAIFGQNAVNLGAHLYAHLRACMLHSRNTVSGVSWLPAQREGEMADGC
jgi:hypothetical protein